MAAKEVKFNTDAREKMLRGVDSVSVEEAYIQTTSLGHGLSLKAGRFMRWASFSTRSLPSICTKSPRMGVNTGPGATQFMRTPFCKNHLCDWVTVHEEIPVVLAVLHRHRGQGRSADEDRPQQEAFRLLAVGAHRVRRTFGAQPGQDGLVVVAGFQQALRLRAPVQALAAVQCRRTNNLTI